jgi:hypothetical protein
MQISIDQVLAGGSGIDMLLGSFQWQRKADACEAAAAAAVAAVVGDDS